MGRESSQGLQRAGPSWTVGGTWGSCVDVGNGSEHKCAIINRRFKTVILSLVCTVKFLGVIFQNTSAYCQRLQLDGLG